MIKSIRILGVGVAILLLSACGDDYFGPLSERPLRSRTDQNGKIIVYTVRDRILEQNVPEGPLDDAFAFLEANRSIVDNTNWMSLIDFTVHSGQPRLHVINLKNGDVEHLLVAHGAGSDPDNTGYARTFSNEENSHMSSIGFYLVAEPYYGKWGKSARLDGLSSTNSNARQRVIVLHGAEYVHSGLPQMGRTWGCPAVELTKIESLVSRLSGNSLLYAFSQGVNPSETLASVDETPLH